MNKILSFIITRSYIINVIMLIQTVNPVTILSPTSRHNHRLGETLTLSCEFEAPYFDMFSSPVLWIKTQHNEETKVNIQGNIEEPFLSTKRFNVRFNQVPPTRYKFELYVKDLTRADNGNYTCEIRGAGSKVLANVTHEVIVHAPANEVFITDSNNTIIENAPSRLVFTENIPSTIRCISQGGYPAPDVHMQMANSDLNNQLSWTYIPVFEGPVGLKSLSYTVERWSNTFLALPDFDGKEVVCTAVVPGLPAHSTAVRVKVNYLPKVTCDTASAYLGERNITIFCLVLGRPRVTSVMWLIGDGGRERDVMTSTAYWTTMRIINDTVAQAVLYISKGDLHRFTNYKIVAKNSIGSGTGVVRLQLRKYKPSSTTRPLLSEKTTLNSASDNQSSRSSKGSHYIFIISSATTFKFPKNYWLLSWTTFCLIMFIGVIR